MSPREPPCQDLPDGEKTFWLVGRQGEKGTNARENAKKKGRIAAKKKWQKRMAMDTVKEDNEQQNK